MTLWSGGLKTLIVIASWMLAATFVSARDLHVDPRTGNDTADGESAPVRTIARAIRLAAPGDTIHLLPIVYRDTAAFYDKSGEPGQPITLDGHGATLEGCEPLDPAAWKEVEAGLFRHDNLLPLTDAIIARWFFLWDGRMQRMQRCSKGPSVPLKAPSDLQPGEWTFVKDEDRAARPGYIHGAFFVQLPAGQPLSKANIEAPLRMAGVSMHGKCAHLIVRNLTATHPYNDGFNLSDCVDVFFENIRAIDCADDGISAHGHCRYHVEGFTSSGNATGICDTGNSETDYQYVQIRDCLGFDLYFLDTGKYSLTDAWIQSSAAKSLYLQGRELPATPCRVSLKNVWFERVTGVNEVRVSSNCQLTARSSTFLNLDLQATGGELEFERCRLGGTVPDVSLRKARMHLWKDAAWRGRSNWYDLESIRVGSASFGAGKLELFRRSVASDTESVWKNFSPDSDRQDGIGADVSWVTTDN